MEINQNTNTRRTHKKSPQTPIIPVVSRNANILILRLFQNSFTSNTAIISSNEVHLSVYNMELHKNKEAVFHNCTRS